MTTARTRRGASRSSTSRSRRPCSPSPESLAELSSALGTVAPVRAVAAAVLFAIGVAMLPGAHAASAAAATSVTDGPIAGMPVPDADPAVTRVDFTFAHRVAGRCRVLVTQVRSPTGTGGKLPLILAIHGADGDPSRLAPLLDVWTKAGYVVAAPTFLEDQEGRANGKALASEVARPGRRCPLRARRAARPRAGAPASTRRARRRRDVARWYDGVRPHLAHVLRGRARRAPRS